MKKINILNYIYQFINYSILIFAIGLYTLSIYVYSKTDSFNSVILILITLGLFVTGSTLFNICWTGKSPCALFVSKILYCVMFVLTFVLGILLILDQEKFVQFMNENMTDSRSTIEEVQKDFNLHFKTMTVLYCLYICLMVKSFLT
jgi:hypothetical protein